MRLRASVWALFLAAIWLGTTASSPARAASIELIARTGTTVGGVQVAQLFQRPDINNSGQVVYAAFNSTGISGGIFNRDGLLVGPGAVIGGNTFSRPFGVHPVINNAGTVVFGMVNTGNQAILATPSNVVFNYATQQVSGEVFSNVGQHALNDAGSVVLYGGVPSTGFAGVIANTTTILVKEGDVIDGRTIADNAVFNVTEAGYNTAGTFVFRAADISGGTHIFSQTARLAGTGSVIDGFSITNANPGAAINDLGQVAFQGSFTGNQSGVFTLNRAVMVRNTTIAGHTLNNFDGDVDINELGQVAYKANYVGGGSGIFLEQSLLVSTGDIVNGTLTISGLGRPALNDLGNVTVHATFTDGTSGIIVVPEPVSFCLTALAMPAILSRRGRRA